MIVIPMAGMSSRFFKAGYEKPKYELPIFGHTVFEEATNSFNRYFGTDKFIFITLKSTRAKEFVKNKVDGLGIKDYKIVELDGATRGQAETVYLGLKGESELEEIYIFNIDTFRYDFIKPNIARHCDGYLEVFKGDGDHWSFVEPGKDNSVVRTTEKDRISDLCSDGLYYFKSKKDFDAIFEETLSSGATTKGEYYVAPMYNELIKQKKRICYDPITTNELDFCGTPYEYEVLQSRIKS